MAYDSLKALIRQYIKTNGEQEITGQILQNVLIEMVNQYPSTDGFATQSWVTSQGYATTSQLADYLPLTGGNLDGNLSIYDTMNIYSSSIEWNDDGDYSRIAFDDDGITVTAHGTGYVIANEFIKNGGTSSQFLKADGSVDSNTYITSASLSGYATQSWVNTQLANYLPLTGGNLNGNLSIYDTMNIYSSSIEWNDDGDYSRIAFDDDGITVTAHGTGYVTANEFIKSGGTSAQFLKADGSVDSNAYITASALSGYATQSWVTTQLGGYLPLTGGNLNGNLSIYDTMNIYSSSIEWNDDGDYSRIAFDDDGITVTAHGTGYVTANEFIKSGGTSAQFLKADGSVTTLKTINGNSLEGSGDIVISGEGGNYLPLTGGTMTGAINMPTSSTKINFKEPSSTANNYETIQFYSAGFDKYGNIRMYGEKSSGASWSIRWTGATSNSNTDISLFCVWAGYEMVSIGNITTPSYKLHVDGAVGATGFNKSGSSDEYVLLGGGGHKLLSEIGGGSGNYLPLTGGTLSGNLTVLNSYLSVVTAGSSATSYTATITGSGIEAQMLRTGTPINNRMVLDYSGLTLYDQNVAGTTITLSSITSGSFIKSGGTSAQFLKADGSVATLKTINGNSLEGSGDIVISGGGNYLPLTGGTMTGAINMPTSSTKINFKEPSWTANNYETIQFYSAGFDKYGNIRMYGEKSSGASWSIIWTGATSNSNTDISLFCVWAGYEMVSIGNITTPSYKLHVDGAVGATGFVNTSDLRKKTIMGDVPMNLYNVANAPLFKFTWNNETKCSGQHIGSAAQYWQTVLPELVIQGSDADLTLAMQYDVIALASAITVAKTVVNHEERIILLERENEALKKEIADLKSA